MDLSQLNSIATSGSSSSAVANALVPRRVSQATAKDSGTTATSGTTGNSSSSGSASDSSDITANDFLTLLVSELQNQDPTQPTDPNQYITQLAQVNSLQQLISINQGIGTLDSAISTPTQSSGSGSNTNSNAIAAVNGADVATSVQSTPANPIW